MDYLYLYLYCYAAYIHIFGINWQRNRWCAAGLFALASQRSPECLCGLMVYHGVGEGIPRDSGSRNEGKPVLGSFPIWDFEAVFVIFCVFITSLVYKIVRTCGFPSSACIFWG